MTFGKQLRAWRRAAGLTSGQLAKRMGVSIAYISQVETGRTAAFSPERCAKAATALGVPEAEVRKSANHDRARRRVRSAINLPQNRAGETVTSAFLMRLDEDMSNAQVAELLKSTLDQLEGE